MIKRIVWLVFLAALAQHAMAIEQPEYRVVFSAEDLEIREYGETIVARTRVNSSFSKAGNTGFRLLAGYIFGDNADSQKISMTAPVVQAANPDGSYWITFFMPSEFSLDELPEPVANEVEITRMPAATYVVRRYKGGWRESLFREHEQELKAWLSAQTEWVGVGEVVWARYNSPMMPSFMRRNEVMIPVVASDRNRQVSAR